MVPRFCYMFILYDLQGRCQKRTVELYHSTKEKMAEKSSVKQGKAAGLISFSSFEATGRSKNSRNCSFLPNS